MKILISLSYYWPSISGLSGYAKNLAEALVEAGNEVTVVCVRQTKELAKLEKIGGAEVRRFDPAITAGKVMVSLQMMGWIRKNIRGFDSVIINLPMPESLIVAALAKIGAGKKVVSVFQCDPDTGNSMGGKFRGLMTRILGTLTFHFSDKIAVISHDYAGTIRYLDRYLKKTVEIWPLIRQSAGKYKNKAKNRNGLTIGFLGRIAREKNLETLIGAVVKDRDRKIRLVIAGPREVIGEKEYRDKIMKLIEKSDAQIQYLGQFTETEIDRFFQQIDILALPSDNPTEAFGLVQAEAMLAGIPVIATNRPGVRVLIQKTGGGRLINEPRNVDAWLREIREAERQLPELRKKTARAKQLLDRKKIISQWMDLLGAWKI